MSSVIAGPFVATATPTDSPSSGAGGGDGSHAAPRRPASLRDSGLTLAQLSDFILKSLYLHGSQAGHDIARELRLPFTVLQDALQFLKEQRCADVTRGEMLGPVSQRFVLTDLGRLRARDALEDCRYIGPAPVPLSQYVDQCRRQGPDRVRCGRQHFEDAFRHLVISGELLRELGPAVCSGRSIFLYGPPGNGKTVIARAVGALLNTHGGEIYVPYAILVENSIVTVFDPAIHQTTDSRPKPVPLRPSDGFEIPEEEASPDPDADLRWRRIRRPVVTTGGELTLDMLDLQQHGPGRHYTAPLHVKANGGVFLIDDFGRQLISPKELLNRWILPLEDSVDYLTLATGNKVAVPFRQLLMFSTNLEPGDLVDEAFLRRIRHRIRIPSPSREVFEQIFHNCCLEREFTYDRRHVDELFERHYNRQRSPRSSDPQDLLEMVTAVCRFRDERPRLDGELLTDAAERLFRDV